MEFLSNAPGLVVDRPLFIFIRSLRNKRSKVAGLIEITRDFISSVVLKWPCRSNTAIRSGKKGTSRFEQIWLLAYQTISSTWTTASL